jgi:ComF family protein
MPGGCGDSGGGRLLRWLDEVAESWIGYALPPPHRWLEDVGWRPDDRRDYCGRCGESVRTEEVGRDGCGGCWRTATRAQGVVRLGAYDGALRAAILSLKHERWHEMGVVLGRHLGEAVAQTALVDGARAVVVPMPMPWQRRLRRGLDHARVIAGGVAAVTDARLAQPLRRSNGPPQTSLSAAERRRLGRRGYRVRNRGGLAGVHVILVDDVMTTGTSMAAAARRLGRLGPARIVVAVVAVADPPQRIGRPDGAEGMGRVFAQIHSWSR